MWMFLCVDRFRGNLLSAHILIPTSSDDCKNLENKFRRIECTSCFGSPRCEIRALKKPKNTGALYIKTRDSFPFFGPGRWRVQVQMGGCWFLFRCSDFQQLSPEGKD